MAIKKHLLVLANSAKQGGRCMAGRVLENRNGSYIAGEWIRPVMPHHNGCDSMPEAVCRQVNPLDVVTLELSSAAPVVGQPENHLWQQESAIDLAWSYNQLQGSLNGILDHPADIWRDIHAHRDDEVTSRYSASQSLYLIQPTDLELQLEIDPRGRRRAYADFSYGGYRYRHIPVTDPLVRRLFINQFPLSGTKRVRLRNGDAYWLTMSLSLPFGPRNCRYKFVAAIIDHSGYIQRSYR